MPRQNRGISTRRQGFLELPAGAEVSAMHWRSRGAGAGVGILEAIVLRLLELLFCQIQSQPIMVGFEVSQADGDVFPAHSQKSADIDDDRRNLPVTVEDQVLTWPILRF
jgi:hypothetical protein